MNPPKMYTFAIGFSIPKGPNVPLAQLYQEAATSVGVCRRLTQKATPNAATTVILSQQSEPIALT